MGRFALCLPVLIALQAIGTAQKAPTAQEPVYKVKKETLKKTLETLGYVPKDLGNNVFQVEVERNDDTVLVAVSLSSSLSKIWLTCNLGNLTEDEKGDNKFLLALLEKNGEIQPTHFYVRKSRLNLGLPLDNRVSTQSNLQKEIVNFADVVIKTKDLWDKTTARS